MKNFVVYSGGLVCMSVCVAGNMLKEDVERNANRQHPTGIDSKWRISEEDFRTGEPNPCGCKDHSGRKHYLLNC